MNFRKLNNITGWAVFFIAFASFFLTREARGSLWDTGEFIACADKVQLPHPPGAPLFVLLGRFFIILFGDNDLTAANAVNFMSALASAATILFLFWTITHFARKMYVTVGEQLTPNQSFTVMAAGAVGALAYAFSDSFWFSAVEGEVYALSSFFTALVFWAMLKWEHSDEHAGDDAQARARSDRWIIFLFFMMGLSIGVHLLNLLSIPAIVMIYYYRRYTPTTKGAIIAFITSCILTGLVQVAVIQYSMKAAGQFDVYFVNSFNLPFFSGFALYFILLAALIVWILRLSEKNISQSKLIIWFILFLGVSFLPFIVSVGEGGIKFLKFLLVGGAGVLAGYFLKPAALRVLKLSLWCYAFMMLGYFMYFTALIRSNANPPIDMNNVDNPINLVYYLSREQYGSAPLVYGPHFSADFKYNASGYVEFKEGEMRYVKGKDRYIPIGKEQKPLYQSSDMQLFPRIWDGSNDQYHADFYAEWLDLGQEESPITGRQRYQPPSFGDNIEWFFSYQMGHMYWRYFMWNYAGKQNDIQGLGNKRDGNWLSGISFIDNSRLGDQNMLPDSIKNNKAHNTFFMLPFILGILGCVFQFLRNRKDWIVTFLLFSFTGIAVVLYLNQPGNQPRERDYAYVGSFYAFAIWIGLAVVAFAKLVREREDKTIFSNTLLYGSVLTFAIMVMSSTPGSGGSVLIASLAVTALYAILVTAVTYLLKAISSGGQNERILNIGAAVICMIAPLLIAQQEWDDHDRSKKTLAPDLARDYLQSCAPNAIIFTFGDNDTYPLWYAQEVEGVRPDIRIINNSLLGIDWYINQLRYKVNQADSVDVIWSPEQIEGNNRARIYYREDAKLDKNKFYPIRNFIDLIGERVQDPKTRRDVGPDTYPIKRFSIPVDTSLVRRNGTVNADDMVLPTVDIEINRSYLDRNDLIILNIIAANNWKRPIYFTSPLGELGFGHLLRKDGLSYRLVPAIPKQPQLKWVTDSVLRQIIRSGTSIRDNNLDSIYNNLMTKYEFGGADKEGVYFDEENRRHLLSIRAIYGEAAGNLADAGRIDQAQKLIDKAESGMNPANFPYAMVSRYNSHNQTGILYLEACYKAGKKELAEKVRKELRKDLEQQKRYYEFIRAEKPEYFASFERTEYPLNEAMLEVLKAVERRYAPEVVQPTTGEGQRSIDTKAPGSLNPADTPQK